jgi:hypothetical protein
MRGIRLCARCHCVTDLGSRAAASVQTNQLHLHKTKSSELARSSSAGASVANTQVPAQPRSLVLALAVRLGLFSAIPVAQAASINEANGSHGQNGTTVNGIPQGHAGGVGSLPGGNDGTLGYSFGGGTYARAGKGGSLANQGVGGGGEGGKPDGGIGIGGGGGNLALLITQSATNTNYIHGGYGGSGGDGGAGSGQRYLGNGNGGGGGGGAGVLIASGATWTNNQISVTGGDGCNGEISGYDTDGSGDGGDGDGGDAVMASDGSGFVNLSSIEGDSCRGRWHWSSRWRWRRRF